MKNIFYLFLLGAVYTTVVACSFKEEIETQSPPRPTVNLKFGTSDKSGAETGYETSAPYSLKEEKNGTKVKDIVILTEKMPFSATSSTSLIVDVNGHDLTRFDDIQINIENTRTRKIVSLTIIGINPQSDSYTVEADSSPIQKILGQAGDEYSLSLMGESKEGGVLAIRSPLFDVTSTLAVSLEKSLENIESSNPLKRQVIGGQNHNLIAVVKVENKSQFDVELHLSEISEAEVIEEVNWHFVHKVKDKCESDKQLTRVENLQYGQGQLRVLPYQKNSFDSLAWTDKQRYSSLITKKGSRSFGVYAPSSALGDLLLQLKSRDRRHKTRMTQRYFEGNCKKCLATDLLFRGCSEGTVDAFEGPVRKNLVFGESDYSNLYAEFISISGQGRVPSLDTPFLKGVHFANE